MLTTIFFSVSFLFIVFLIVVFWSDLKGTSSKAVEEKKVEKKRSPWISEMFASVSSALWAMFCVFAAGITLALLLHCFLDNDKSNRHTAPKGSVMILPEDIRPNQEVKVKVQRGILSWCKPKDVRGGDPDLRKSPSMKTKIIRNDKSVMEFTAEYEYRGEKQVTHFRWNKNEEQGTWSQDYPQADGHWHLNRVSNSVFEGEQSDSSGTSIPMKLELI